MKYTWSVPEVMQISQMDCGPCCLKSVLQGFHIPVHFGRLREACQTDVDGTSVDTIEVLACELGLAAQQVLVPLNHLHLPEAKTTPSILIVQLPNQLTHFVVVWRSFGPWVQVMDPSHGRHWLRWETLKQKVYKHRMPLHKDVWEAWAASDEYRLALVQRASGLGFSANAIHRLFAKIFEAADRSVDENISENNIASDNLEAGKIVTENWLAMASLDAAITWTESLVQASALKKGKEAVDFFQVQYARAVASLQPWVDVIPKQYWWTIQDEKNCDSLRVEAAVLVRIDGVAEKNIVADAPEKIIIDARIKQLEPSPWTILQKLFLPQQRKLVRWMIPIMIVASATVALQALLFQGLLGMSSLLGQQQSFNPFIPLLFLFIVLSTLLELPIARMAITLGRQLESQLRIALFNKIPKIHDPYFRSRLLTDMARRSHRLYLLRSLPGFAVAILQQFAVIIFTLIGILWLDFTAGVVACVMAILICAVSFFWQTILQDAMARAETQTGVISMLYFDTLKGLRAIRSHSAQATFANEHEIQLSRWGATQYVYLRKKTGAFLLLDLFALVCIAALMFSKTIGADAVAPSVLWFYWVLRLPSWVTHLSLLIMELPQYYITLALYTELLEATEVAQVHGIQAEKSSVTAIALDETLLQLRQQTAWVDANIQLWDRSLLDNLNYDHGNGSVSEAGLGKVLAGLPDGLQTPIGEGGKRLSGGEGQRVRIARALGAAKPRLVILDEPCRGLDRVARELLLQKIRTTHAQATLICITHDISEALKFPHILVVGQGRVLEQGEPHALLAQPNSALSHLRQCEQKVLNTLLQDRSWQPLQMVNGRLAQGGASLKGDANA